MILAIADSSTYVNIFDFYSFSKIYGLVTNKTPTYPAATQTTYILENVSYVLAKHIKHIIIGNNITNGIQML